MEALKICYFLLSNFGNSGARGRDPRLQKALCSDPCLQKRLFNERDEGGERERVSEGAAILSAGKR